MRTVFVCAAFTLLTGVALAHHGWGSYDAACLGRARSRAPVGGRGYARGRQGCRPCFYRHLACSRRLRASHRVFLIAVRSR
jgi:hypothetical protein